jgi:hypothetical protein
MLASYLGLGALLLYIIGFLALIIHVTMGFEEFFEGLGDIFTKNPREAARKRQVEKQKHSDHP